MAADRWHAYFTVHGDPFVVEDPGRPQSTIVATVSTAPEDYGRANALLIARAPDLLAENERLREALRLLLEPPFGSYCEWWETGSTRSADAMNAWQDKALVAYALLQQPALSDSSGGDQ